MAERGRPKAELVLTDEEQQALTRWARRRKSAQALAVRSRIVLGCAQGLTNKEVAARERVSQPTVGKWRSRFVEARLDGLVDEPRPGRPATITADQVEDVVVATLESTPDHAAHWSRSLMAVRCGLSKSTIGRIWKAFELQPRRAEGFKLSNDPLLHRRHRAIEFKKFLTKIDAEVPAGLDIHRQLRHPQSARRDGLARQAPPLPHALHANLFQLDQPN